MAVVTYGPGTLYVGTANTTSTTGTWLCWNNQYWNSVGTITAGTTWIQWNTVYQQQPASWDGYIRAAETDEQRAERERQAEAEWERRRQRPRRPPSAALTATEQADWDRRYEEQQRQDREARERAEELLLALLSDEQAQDWREHGHFFVCGSSSGRRYRIRRGIAHNVDRMWPSGIDEPDMNYCAHPPGIPAEDVCLAQMFLIATDEDAFLRVANSRPVGGERRLQAVA